MTTNQVVKRESVDYLGEIALCKGSTTVEAPKPSPEEIALQAEQLKILQQQQTTSEKMEPFILKGMGIVEEGGILRYMTEEERLANMTSLERGQYEQAQESTRQQGLRWKESEAMKPFMLTEMNLVEENGKLRQMTEKEILAGMTNLEKSQYEQEQNQYVQQKEWHAQQKKRYAQEEKRYVQEEKRAAGRYEIEQLQQERLRKAYAGELPISPALEQKLTKQEEQIAEALNRRLGSGWQSTTSGQQAMSTFRKDANLIREETRRGEISSGTGLLLSNLGLIGQIAGQTTGQSVSQGNLQALTQMGAFPQRTGGLLSGYNTMLDGTAQQTGSGAAKYPYLSDSLFQGYGMLQQPYQQQRQMEFSASAKNAQMAANKQAGFWGGMGNLIGTGMGVYGSFLGAGGKPFWK